VFYKTWDSTQSNLKLCATRKKRYFAVDSYSRVRPAALPTTFFVTWLERSEVIASAYIRRKQEAVERFQQALVLCKPRIIFFFNFFKFGYMLEQFESNQPKHSVGFLIKFFLLFSKDTSDVTWANLF